jgi:predicted secreted protein
MAVNGNNIIVSQYNGSSWVAIAATKSDELTVDGEQIEISDSSDSEWKHFIGGRKSWSLNVGWLVTQVADIRKVLTVNTRVQLRIGARTFASDTGLTGYAIVRTAKVTAQRGGLANGSFAFQGDGPLT